MENQEKSRRLVLFPLPYQGHINPMLQLANILHSKGFTIIIIHTHFNSPNPSNYPHFTFHPISQGSLETPKASSTDISGAAPADLVTHFNKSCVEPFRDCLARLLSEEPIASLIVDAFWIFTQAVADSFKLPRIMLRPSSVSSLLVFAAYPLLSEKGYLSPKDATQLEAPVPELPPLTVKDVQTVFTSKLETLNKLIANMVKGIKGSSGLIWNTFRELDEPELEACYREFPIPTFPIGPFIKYLPTSSSSLLAQDRTSISWLDLQAPKSVIYVSFGSIASMDEADFKEMAWGLANSKQPFLWVVRPGFVHGSEWLEPLPNGFLKAVGERGHIVKWAPQQQVLGHPATGCFWTHNGWNSTLESICEGVPMICSPSFGDQPVNARYVSHVWNVGIQLENGLERGGIEMAIRRVMVNEEGKGMREKVMCLKEKANLCMKQGGSSFQSLEGLVNYILSL